MKPLLLLSAFVSAGVWLIGNGSMVLAQARERVIPYEPGVSIRERLLPDDDVVFIRRTGDIDPIIVNRNPTLVQAVEYVTYLYDAIVVVTPQREVGQLSADESWVETKTEGTIREVLKGTPDLRQGQPVSVIYPGGGEAVLGRTQVRAGTRYPVSVGKSCVMFLLSRPEGLIQSSILGIENGKLVSFDSSSTGKNKKKTLWDGLELARVAKLIRTAALSQHKQ
jgi:hypothetical protein